MVSVVVPLPPSVPALFWTVARWIGSLAELVDVIDRGPVPASLIWPALLGVLMLVLPGILIMVTLWLLLHRLFAGAGVGALAIGLGAREPHLTDLEERQLVNIVEEMAIAAGLPAPKVMLFDGEVANAAAVGSSPSDAMVIVSRRLLDEMNRDETQGVLAHAIASIGNGDLGVALSMVTVFRTFGLVNTLLDAPVSRSARDTLGRLFFVLGDRTGRDAATRASDAARLLGARVSMMDLEDVNLVLGSEEEKQRAPAGLVGLLLKVRVFALFPIWAAAGMAKTALMVMIFGLVGPLLALTWRTRRFLADATAVQLTRNPDGVADGLAGLLARGGGIRGGAWADHLFVVGGGVRDGASDDEVGGLSWVSFHPSLESRLKRLRALGARVDDPAPERPRHPAQTALMVAIVAPFAAIIAVLLGVVVVLATGLTVVFMMIPLGIVYFFFEWLY
jgi:Zn-dependent protease with chaperone function